MKSPIAGNVGTKTDPLPRKIGDLHLCIWNKKWESSRDPSIVSPYLACGDWQCSTSEGKDEFQHKEKGENSRKDECLRVLFVLWVIRFQ